MTYRHMTPAPVDLVLLAEAERACDGPLPSGLLALILGKRPCIHRHTVELEAMAEARRGIRRRRAGLTAARACGDGWLARLAATLAHHRHRAAVWHGTGGGAAAPDRPTLPL